MNTEIVTKSNFELLINLIGSIIWPVTILLILLIFRRNLSEIIQRLGSVKADGTGVAISFENRIAATQKVFKQIRPESISKSAQEIRPAGINTESPFTQISDVKTNLVNYLKSKASADNINTTGLSAIIICEKLKETGAISMQKAKMIHALLEVIDAAKPSATKEQAEDIEELYNRIDLN